MDSKVNYTIVGLFVIVLGVAVIAGAYWMTADRSTKKYKTYAIFMNEPVSGLNIQAPVKFNGVEVGFVKSIRLNFQNPQQVILLVDIEDGTPITTSTVATLMAQGITGITYVGLKAETPTAQLLLTKPGQRYPVIQSTPSLLVQLDAALREVTTNIKSLSNSFRKVFDEENTKAIKNILANIDVTTKTLADNSQNIDSVIQSAKTVLSDAAKASHEFPEVVKRLRSNLQTLQATLKKVGHASDSVSKTMNAGRSAIKNISTQAVPPAIDLVNRLDSLSVDLQQIAKQMRHNPSILVRGKVPAALGPGER